MPGMTLISQSSFVVSRKLATSFSDVVLIVFMGCWRASEKGACVPWMGMVEQTSCMTLGSLHLGNYGSLASVIQTEKLSHAPKETFH